MPAADNMCSGRRSCEIPIPNSHFDLTKPCPNDLKSYLETSFSCLKGKEIAENLSLSKVNKNINYKDECSQVMLQSLLLQECQEEIENFISFYL